MSTELVVSEKLQLQAVNGQQMVDAHSQMRDWILAKIATLQRDLMEEMDAREIARRNKWATKRHDRKIKEYGKRILFFQKIDAALEAGFVIVPNFGMDIFAIRTDRDRPARNEVNGSSWGVSAQSARVLPVGEGEYRNPQTDVDTDEYRSADGKEISRKSYAVGGWAAVDFPFALAKPALMDRTAEAMALKCFDEIGVVHDSGVVKGDPYIIGRIKNPGKRPSISFFIGWFFDPSAL